MKNVSKTFIKGCAIAFIALGTISAASLATAQQAAFPNKPIRWIVGFPPGGASDFLARTVGQAMSEQLGQAVIIDNRPGAAAMIGADVAAKSAPDGYTVWSGDMATLVFNPMIYQKMTYKVSDFRPVGLMGRFNMALATSNNTGFDSLPAAIEGIRKSPGKYTYASVGAGTPQHLGMERLMKNANLKMVHVPYKGMAPAMQDLLGGQVDFAIIDAASAVAQLSGQKIKVLALMSEARIPQLANVPTVGEAGFKGSEMYAWQGMLVPAGTPLARVDALSDALKKALAKPEVRKAVAESGLEVTLSSPREFGDYIESENRHWEDVVKSTGLRIDN